MLNKTSGGNSLQSTVQSVGNSQNAVATRALTTEKLAQKAQVNYVVKPGDTLSKIAEQVGVSMNTILQDNPSIKNPNNMVVGQKINLNGGASKAIVYTVKSGDTLAAIAKKHGTTVGDILRANPGQINNTSLVFPGQQLNIPAGKIPSAGQQVNVLAGKTPSAVSTAPAQQSNKVDVLLPASGTGYVIYNTDGNDQYGTAATIATIKKMGEMWNEKHSDVSLQVGDISRKNGGSFAPVHQSHRTGIDVDLRPIRKDGKMSPLDIKSDPSQLDTAKVRDLIGIIRKISPKATIYFNDPALIKEGLTTFMPGHSNHLHVRFK